MTVKKISSYQPVENELDKLLTPKKFCRNLLHGMATILMAVFVVGLLPVPSMGYLDNDYPHNNLYNLSCETGTCHDMGRDYRLPVYPSVDNDGDLGCLWCHDGIPKPTQDPDNPENTILLNNPTGPVVVSHSSATTSSKYGTWSQGCLDCHDGMWQQQFFAWGAESYLYSGVSTTTTDNFVDGVYVNSTLTMNGANWTPGSLVGMLLFPDLGGSWWEMFYITGNTPDTITVKGPMGILGRSTNFAVTYRMMISQQVPYEEGRWYLPDGNVRFFRPTGQNSFADGDTTYDGICEVCHTQTNHHRNDGSAPAQSHFNGARCTTCHPHSAGFKATSINHLQAGVVVPAAQCTACHTTAGDPAADVHGNQCGLCHVDPAGAGPLVAPLESTVPNGGNCTTCHGTDISQIHQNVDHTVTSIIGPVTLFDQHDGAGSFAVLVYCSLCHADGLVAIHGNDCATCHPSPRDTLATWDRSCQQCHLSYHDNSTTAHSSFQDASVYNSTCNLCHDQSWAVPQANCLNCHADASQPSDVTPPETFCNAQPQYIGPAKLSFSIVDNGKVGVGRTFYRLDGGPATASGKYLFVAAPGAHTLEFWSMDQVGNTEAPPKTATFTTFADTTAPTTVSNAVASYNESALITLTATDASTLGVKTTYFSLNGGPTQIGTTVFIPATPGVIAYSLVFWSEDWAGNVELQHSVSFIVTSGSGVIRLVWGNSDTDGSPCPDIGDGLASSWTIGLGGSNKVIKSGSGVCPGWSGVNDVAVSINPSKAYWVTIDWWNSDIEDWDQTTFPNVPITTAGQLVRLSY